MRGYVKRRYEKDWGTVQQRMDQLLKQASSFIEPLTRLPLVATLLAELLPRMDLQEVPTTRWELFNTLLLSGLLRRDLPDGDAEVVTNDFRQLPPERQEALLLLSDLALQGLLATPPKLVFRYADIVAKSQGHSKAVKKELLEVAKSVMVSFCETDETQEVTFYHFLHLSFQEFLAAMSLRYPMDVNAEKYGASRLASSAKTITIGERFDNFWLFAAGFFKTEPLVFFKTLFSSVNIDMRTVNKQQVAMQNMLFQMLQEMIPEINKSIGEKYSLALEYIAVVLRRKVANIDTVHAGGRFRQADLAALCHTLRLLPGLVTFEWYFESSQSISHVLDALQNQHNLQTLLIFCYRSRNLHTDGLETEVKFLASLLQVTSLVNFRLLGIEFSDEELQTLAGGLSQMNHSLKSLSLWGDRKPRENATAMEALCTAVAKHHTSLLCLEIKYMDLYNYSAIQPLLSLLGNSNEIERLVVRNCPMSNTTFELLCSAVQRKRSLTSLRVNVQESFIFKGHWTIEQKNKRRARVRVQRLSHMAIHHTSIKRLELTECELNDTDAMGIVKEVLKTKGEPHQLRELSIGWNDLTKEGVERLRELLEENQLNLTLAVGMWPPTDRMEFDTGPIVELLPFWSAIQV